MKPKIELTVGKYCKLCDIKRGFFIYNKSEFPNLTTETIWFKHGDRFVTDGNRQIKMSWVLSLGEKPEEAYIAYDSDTYVYALRATSVGTW